MLVARGRTKGRDVEALTDVSFAVDPGEAVGLIGRNGSGKTTLLKIVAGIIKPTAGRVDRRRARSAACSSSAPASTPSSRAARTST